jgi:hypothetical protein
VYVLAKLGQVLLDVRRIVVALVLVVVGDLQHVLVELLDVVALGGQFYVFGGELADVVLLDVAHFLLNHSGGSLGVGDYFFVELSGDSVSERLQVFGEVSKVE